MKKIIVISALALAGSYASAACSIFPAPVSEDPECMVEYWESEVSQGTGDTLSDVAMCWPKQKTYSLPMAHPLALQTHGIAPSDHFGAVVGWDRSGNLLAVYQLIGPFVNTSVGATEYTPGESVSWVGGSRAVRLFEYKDGAYVEHTSVIKAQLEDGGLQSVAGSLAVSEKDGVLVTSSVSLNYAAEVYRRDGAGNWAHSQTISSPNVGYFTVEYDDAASLLFAADLFGQIDVYKLQANGSFTLVDTLPDSLAATSAVTPTYFGIAMEAKGGELWVGATRYKTSTSEVRSGAVVRHTYSASGAIAKTPSFMDSLHDGKQVDYPTHPGTVAEFGAGITKLDNGDVAVGSSHMVTIYDGSAGPINDNSAITTLTDYDTRSTLWALQSVGNNIYRHGLTAVVTSTRGGYVAKSARIVPDGTGYRFGEQVFVGSEGVTAQYSNYYTMMPLHTDELLVGRTIGPAFLANAHTGSYSLFDFEDTADGSAGCEASVLPAATAQALLTGSESDGFCFGNGISSDPDCTVDAIEAGAAWAQTESAKRAYAITSGYDADSDLIPDAIDNCPFDENSNQYNIDGDAEGDACDGDIDGDGTPNGQDDTPEGDYAAEHDKALSTALANAAPYIAGADQDGDGDFDRNDLDVLLGLEFDNYRPMFGDGSSSAPRDQMLYLAGNRLINILNRISEGDAPGAIVEGAQTYLEVMASAFGTSGGRNELLRAPAETAIDTLE